MSGIDQWFPGLESVNGVSPLVLAGGALAAVVLIVALVSMARGRRVKVAPLNSEPVMSQSSSSRSVAWPVAVVIASLAIAAVVTFRSGDPGGTRRSFESRNAELTMRALAPGSPLACLDAVGSVAVEAVCEKTLFSSPETLAAAIAYVDARLSLFVEGSEMGRNSGAGDAFERLRRSIETDRYGLVAHVLTTRGCDADNCPTLNLMRDSTHVAGNLRDRAFEANVVLHAGSWRSDVSAVASAPPAVPTAPSLASAPMPSTPTSTAPAAPTPASPSKFEFPSSSSIPAVSIMSPEPQAAAPKAAEQAAPPPPAPKPAPARRQSARERANNETTSQSPGAPVQIAPQHEAPAPAGTLANPGTPR